MGKQKSVINKTEVRRRILQFARDTRFHPFTRVSAETLASIESSVEAMIRHTVQSAPSKGQTL